jgi:hypothetical protein
MNDWSSWIITPTPYTLETEMDGPYSVKDIEWIEVNAQRVIKEGKLVNEKTIDCSSKLEAILVQYTSTYIQEENSFKLYIPGRL